MNKSLGHLEFFVVHIQKTLLYFNNTNPTDSQFLSIGMLQRLLHVSVGLKSMLEHIVKDNNRYLVFCSALVVRPIVLDVLIITDLIVEMANWEDNEVGKAEI